MTIYTIGFTKKRAATFFGALRDARVASLLDVRLNNTSQLAGFTRRDDLAFFCDAILGVPYRHLTELAPEQAMLDAYRAARDWVEYERVFVTLMRARRIEDLPRAIFEDACLLCSEPEPAYCHRRLAAEYLHRAWTDVQIVHL